MFNFKRILAVSFMLSVVVNVVAQRVFYRYEVGGNLGLSNYIGDINPLPTSKGSKPFLTIWGKRYFNQFSAFKAGISRFEISASDANTNSEWQKNRNLSFSTVITDFSLVVEHNFLPYLPGERGFRFTPFFNAGLSFYKFNPIAVRKGREFLLNDFGTEGQKFKTQRVGSPYKLNGFAIPVSGGFKFNPFGFWSFGIEAGARLTFTDYLDDISTIYPSLDKFTTDNMENAGKLSHRWQEINGKSAAKGKMRGNSTFKDNYIYFGATITYSIPSSSCPSFK